MVNKDPDWSIFSNMFLSKSFFQQPMVCEVLWLDGKFTHFYVIDNYAWPHCEASTAQFPHCVLIGEHGAIVDILYLF